ncbi:MAG: DNA polymerase III subunit alpha, partial [Synergistaceae bacterium]|nr:DNA polymerase III subunit alpha [Synergistaceae bacterium]
LRTVNRGVVENLIKSGAFAALEPNRRKLLESLPMMLEITSRRDECSGQYSLFDDDEAVDEPEMPDVPDFDQRRMLEGEHEAVGIYISGHPYDDYRDDEAKYATCGIRDLIHWKTDAPPAVIGLLAGFKERVSKRRGEPFGILTLEDADSSVEAVCYSREWPKVKPILNNGEPYLVSGSLKNDGDPSIIIDSIESLSEIRTRAPNQIRVKISAEGLPDDFFGSFQSELKKYPGNLTVLLDLKTGDEQALLRIRSLKVSMEPALAERINELSGGRAYVVA